MIPKIREMLNTLKHPASIVIFFADVAGGLLFAIMAVLLAIMAVLLAIMAVVLFLSWPSKAFQRNVSWIGEVFWIVILLLAASVAFISLARTKHEQEHMTPPDISSSYLEADKSAFENKVRSCLHDRSIVGYFKRNLVKEDDVTAALVAGAALKQALAMDSYKSFASGRSRVQDMTRQNSYFLIGAVNFRTVTVFAGAAVLIALLFTEISMSDGITSGIAFTSLIFAAASAWLFAVSRMEPEHKPRELTFALSFLTICISLCIIIVPPIVLSIKWAPFVIVFPVFLVTLVIFYILPTEQTIKGCLSLLAVGLRQGRLLFLRDGGLFTTMIIKDPPGKVPGQTLINSELMIL